MPANINCFYGGIDLRTFYTWLFCTSVCQTGFTKFLKNVQKALELCTVVIAYDPDSTILGALYGCIHAFYNKNYNRVV